MEFGYKPSILSRVEICNLEFIYIPRYHCYFMFYKNIMQFAINLAYNNDPVEVPVASVIAIENNIIAFSDNRVERDNIEWHHAEFLAITKAIQNLNTKYLDKASIYITLEPCILCSSLLDRVRINEIYFGSYSLQKSSLTKCIKLFSHLSSNTTIIGGLFDDKCFPLIKNFFKQLR